MTDKKTTPSALSFELLEDVMELPRPAHEEIVSRALVFRIGPLVEYAYHNYEEAIDRLAPHGKTRAVASFSHALKTPGVSVANSNWSLQALPGLEFYRSPQTMTEVEDARWVAFCRRLMDAGQKAGLPKGFSQGLAGTFEEMTSNILEHSERPGSGLVGYQWREGEFEYVVADAGVGVLESLKQHADYSWLLDSGQALEVAVCDGESRYGREAHRGTGFHNLLYNIANRNSYVRFRSGDHSYTIDGTQTPSLKKTQSCSPFQGFLISIISRVPKTN
jgi:hypothetical protein